jgi:chitodextrinase
MVGELSWEKTGSNGTVAIVGNVRRSVIETIDADVVRAPQQVPACVLDAQDPDLVYTEDDAVWVEAVASRLETRHRVDRNHDHEKYSDQLDG